MIKTINSAKGLLILEEEDFELVESGKIVHLTHTVNCKFSVVIFYTDECDQCRIVKPILMSYVGNPTIQICMVNIYDADSSNLISLSQNTTTPLRHVPLIIFYVNGIPYKRYDGGYNHHDFNKFIKDVVEEASQTLESLPDETGEIPPYTIGKPNSAKVCYLTYQKAY